MVPKFARETADGPAKLFLARFYPGQCSHLDYTQVVCCMSGKVNNLYRVCPIDQ